MEEGIWESTERHPLTPILVTDVTDLLGARQQEQWGVATPEAGLAFRLDRDFVDSGGARLH